MLFICSVTGLNPGSFILFVYGSSRLLNIYILSDVSVSWTETIFKDLKIFKTVQETKTSDKM